jgi:hypothetical protein
LGVRLEGDAGGHDCCCVVEVTEPPELDRTKDALVRWIRRIRLPDRDGREHAVEGVVAEIFDAYDAAEAPRDRETLRAILVHASDVCWRAGFGDARREAWLAVVIAAQQRHWPEPPKTRSNDGGTFD